MTTTLRTPIGLTEKDLAAELSVSVCWLQHDRRKARLIPFYRIGTNIRYNKERVLQALSAMEEGGTSLPKSQRARA